MRALVIRPGKRAEIVQLPNPNDIQGQLNIVKEYVGGWFESLPAPLGHFLFVNEEAHMLDLPYNYIASQLFFAVRHFRPSILGTALLVGPVNTNGDNTDVTDEFIAYIKLSDFIKTEQVS